MQAQVLPTSQAEASIGTFAFAFLVGLSTFHAVCHEALQLGERFFDFWNCSRAVNELPLRGKELMRQGQSAHSEMWRICAARTCWYETMRDSKETVFPVPEGISSTQWPFERDLRERVSLQMGQNSL